MSNALIDRTWRLSVHYTDKLVLLYLADRANAEGACWPSVATMAAQTSLSDRAVQKALRRLEEAGHVSQFWKTPEKAKRPMRHFRVHPRTTFTPEADSPPNEVHPDPERGSPLPPNDVHHPPERGSPKPPVNPKGTQKEPTPPSPLVEGGRVADFADWLVSEWNAMARPQQLPPATKLNPRAAAKLETAYTRKQVCQALGMIPRSPILMGKKPMASNPGFTGATFAWFAKPGTIERILNGAYQYGPTFNTGDDQLDALHLKLWESERCTKGDGTTKLLNRSLIGHAITAREKELGLSGETSGAIIEAEYAEVPRPSFWDELA